MPLNCNKFLFSFALVSFLFDLAEEKERECCNYCHDRTGGRGRIFAVFTLNLG